MTRYAQRTLLQQPTLGNWGQAAAGGIGVVAGYGVATGTPSVSASYSDGGFTWKRIDFTGSNNLVVSTAGLFDFLIIGGGGGAATQIWNAGGGGGGASSFQIVTVYVAAGTYAVTIGGGGAENTNGGQSYVATLKLESSRGTSLPTSIGYNSCGANHRPGYGSQPAPAKFGVDGFQGGGADGTANCGGGGGAGGAGGTRTAGAGITSTFTGTSTTYCAGGLGGGTTGVQGGAAGANTGTGGAGAIGTGTGLAGGSGFVSVRFRV